MTMLTKAMQTAALTLMASTVAFAADNEQSVSVQGTIINKAVGPNAVSEQNIPGRHTVAKNATIKTVNGKTTVIPNDKADSTPLEAREDFINAKLAGKDLSNKNFSGMDFTNANLARANLRHANMQNAVLINADLRHADLSGANLKGADLTNARLDGARTDGTVWK
ncbi:pentapeptide repeat-containing protein [Exercitatus varius]|uniref:pentapeptide repeat-containing protein n=1 Tax=Exercitatus varius TaxID=67857 RepID=UPI00294AFA16|nr:pentapeptide repeat-containing protein [Exercitatus varius]MDG2942166.1 pentapeptide repeat-containing protein [Exercitatus varius]